MKGNEDEKRRSVFGEDKRNEKKKKGIIIENKEIERMEDN